MSIVQRDPIEIKKFVAKKIREARRDCRLSQRDLAEKLGVSDKTVSAWESGRSEPSLFMLYEISDTTNQPVNFFLMDQDYSIASKLSSIEKELRQVRERMNQED